MGYIQFRGQDKDGKWHYGNLNTAIKLGDLAIGEEIAYITKCNSLTNDCIMTEANPQTIGQSIGKRDVADKEIYEGDILAIEQKEGFVPFGVVRWQTDRFIIDDNFGKYIDLDKAPISKMLEKYNFKVINNIHDNPELKKGGLNANPF